MFMDIAQLKILLTKNLVNILLNIVENYKKSEDQFEGSMRDKNDKMVYHIQNKDKIIDLISADPVSKIATQKLNDKYFRWLPETDPNYILHYYNADSQLDLHIDTFILC